MKRMVGLIMALVVVLLSGNNPTTVSAADAPTTAFTLQDTPMFPGIVPKAPCLSSAATVAPFAMPPNCDSEDRYCYPTYDWSFCNGSWNWECRYIV